MSCYTPVFLKKLKKVPSLGHRRGSQDLPVSQSEPEGVRKGEPGPSPSFKARFDASEEQQFKMEWGRIQEVVFDLYGSFKRSIKDGAQGCTKMPKGTLTVLHDDIHMLLRSKAGNFVFDFIQKKILPAATQILYESILDGKSRSKDESGSEESPELKIAKDFNVDILLMGWKHFYSHILPDIEMIFADVNSHSHVSVRCAALLAFRDGVVLNLLDELILVLQDHSKIKRQIFSLRQMLLVLQSASEKYPPSESKICLEKVIALVVSPYQGYHGLYSGFSNEPVVERNDLSTSDLTLLQEIDEEEDASLPLPVNSSPGVETLQDLFALSADRTMQQLWSKNKSKSNRKRSVSTSEELFVHGWHH